MSTITGFEEDMEKDARDYGQDAMLRRLGALARQRREELGLSRRSFVEVSGIASDATIRDFEYGKTRPFPRTLRTLEKHLRWRNGVIDEMLRESEKRRASGVVMEDLDAWDAAPKGSLSDVPLPDLLREVADRLDILRTGMGPAVPSATTQDMLGLAAMGHKPEHLDDEADDDISGFKPKPDEPSSN